VDWPQGGCDKVTKRNIYENTGKRTPVIQSAAFIFNVEENAKQKTSMKKVARRALE
jgi:hypothetical protein